MKNSQRLFVKIIKEICTEGEIELESFSYDWIFHLSKNGKTAHIFGYQFGNNSATSQLICADKCATSDILLFNGVPAVKHDFFMSPTNINYVVKPMKAQAAVAFTLCPLSLNSKERHIKFSAIQELWLSVHFTK